MEHLCAFVKRLFRRTVIDTCSFRLHYKLTFPLLLFISILVAWRQHFGPAIICTSRYDSQQFLTDYCYAHSTYSVKESYGKAIGIEIPYPGVEKNNHNKEKVYHNYYAWVSLVLFIQAVMFVLPRLFWKYVESGRIEDITKDLQKFDAGKEDLRQDIIKFVSIRLQSELKHNARYFSFYVLAEIFNVVNVIGQMLIMDAFLGGKFFSYGPRVLQFTGQEWLSGEDPAIQLFPRMAHCDFYVYGSSGDVQKHSSLCLLPINSLNAKIYAFLWFWFLILAIVSCASVLMKLLFFVLPRFRLYVLMSGNNLVNGGHVRHVVSRSSAADCFLIQLMKENLGSAHFRDLITYLAENGTFEDPKGKMLLED